MTTTKGAPSEFRFAVAQIGARHHYAVPKALEAAGLLAFFQTDLCAEIGWARALRRFWPNQLRTRSLQRLFAREIPGLPSNKVRQLPWFGLTRAIKKFWRNTTADTKRQQLAANRSFCEAVVRKGLKDANAVFVFNGAALEILKYAKSCGMLTVLDQTSAPVAHEQELFAEERNKWPEWEKAGITRETWLPFAEREQAEWEYVDLLLCGSDHVRSLVSSKVPRSRCLTIPYGIDNSRFSSRTRKRHAGPLRVLFAGHVRLMKGIPYLMEAARLLGKKAEVRAIGEINVSDAAVTRIRETLDLPGAVPRSRMKEMYDWADVFVLPSLSEGSATVCYEALVSGLPVVATPNSGSVVRDAVDGYIVPPFSPEAIAEKLEKIADEGWLLEHLSENAAQRGREFTWERYSERLVAAIRATSSGSRDLIERPSSN